MSVSPNIELCSLWQIAIIMIIMKVRIFRFQIIVTTGGYWTELSGDLEILWEMKSKADIHGG